MIKKRVLFIVEAMGGGVYTYIIELANELVKKYDIYIAYAIRPQTPKNYKDEFNKEINLIEISNLVRNISPINDLKALIAIRKLENDIKPDIIHLHSSKAGVLGRWAFRGKKNAIFYTPHGYSFLMADCGYIKRVLYRQIEKISAKRNCTTICCSYGEYRETLSFNKNTKYVNNGVNIKQLKNLKDRSNATCKNKFTVSTLGRICFQKNPKMFNDIAISLPEIEFVWIGDGELRNELNAPNITITGWMTREDALLKMLSTNIFILTSLWEGLPISLLEAMYMKKVCIVSNVIGNNDVIRTGRNGYVCDNCEDFISVIKTVKENFEEVNILIKNAYEDILETYNTKIMAEMYSRLYERK